MEIKGKKVLVFGGAGLVGTAICRKIMEEQPKELVVCSLYEHEVSETISYLKSKFRHSKSKINGVYGNIFVRTSIKDKSREAILGNQKYRRVLIHDTIGIMDDLLLKQSYLYQTLQKFKPDIVIDSINTATALAYQDIYRSAEDVLRVIDKVKSGKGNDFVSTIERHLCTLYTPQLVRHTQILYESMKRTKVRIYIKIGTSGTGGMGLNIPYTHSEERPSRVLLSKSVMAGAHSILLFLMARTPDSPIIKEIKPAAAIAWKGLGFGPIIKRGKTIPLYDCPPEQAVSVSNMQNHDDGKKFQKLKKDRFLKAVYIDTGENGFFSRGEFETITALGQMEYVTPEEIAKYTLFEIKGMSSGFDVINALDTSIMGPTYRAGAMRERAIEQMKQLEKKFKKESVAFEILGPPRLSKLLYEAYLIKKVYKTIDKALQFRPAEMSRKIMSLVKRDKRLRAEIISIGIPILLPEGKKLLRGPEMKIPTSADERKATSKNIDRWAYAGWVDLRTSNMMIWKERFKKIKREIESLDSSETGSHYDRDMSFWKNEKEMNVGKLVSWIFISEESGMRMKA